jgi:hypothetical protein
MTALAGSRTGMTALVIAFVAMVSMACEGRDPATDRRAAITAPDAGQSSGNVLGPNEPEPALFDKARALNVCASALGDGTMHTPVDCPKGMTYDHGPERCVPRVAPPPAAPRPPPLSFTEMFTELAACKRGPWTVSGAVSHGRCNDGKRFFDENGFFSGRQRFYLREQLVGVSTWTDVGPGSSEGDVGCVVVERVGLCGTPLSVFP